ncbi:MAG: hypothetical protein HFE63_02895 [Clostridiales bacterium]|nr:hypothetical protein [Clostridiales bacterium]
MKRRLISMALCLFMVFTAVATASCGKDDDLSTVGEDQIANAMTLNIYGIKGAGTTDEAIAAVEEAMSKITESQFNTAIKLMLYTESEYDRVLEKKMDEIQERLDIAAAEAEAKKAAEKEARKNGVTTAVEDTTTAEESETGDETIINEYGLVETFYPEIEENQLDIFLMTDYDMFMKYSEKNVLSALDESLSSSSKILKSYINPNILSAGKIGKTTYAILNNQPIGEYTFMLLNKSLMDKYYYDADNFATFNDAVDFILEVAANDRAYTPFMGDISPVGVNYFTVDGSRTVVGNMLAPSAKYGDNGQPKALFSVRNWTNYMTAVKRLEENNCIGSTEIKAGDRFGVGIIKGTYADVAAFEDDYYINVLQNPQATYDNIYNGMFAVSTYTKSLSRSMEIITYLNTRSDLRNLFAYGIEDIHYELDKEGVVHKLSNDYNMKLEYTGNEFIAYPPEGSDPDIWENAKAQNLDMELSPYYGFVLDESKLDPAVVRGVKTFSDRFYSEYASKSSEELADWFLEYWDDADDNASVQDFLATEDEDTEDDYVPMGKLYSDWYATVSKAS